MTKEDFFKLSIPGLELFNEQKYWECHEEFEDHWLEYRHDSFRLVWWAIIQAAACLIHVRDGKIEGAEGMILKTKEKLKRIEESDIDKNFLVTFFSWKEFSALIALIPPKPRLEDFKNLSQFRFSETWKR